MENGQLKSFKNLLVWQKAVDLASLVYEITEKFPKSELYGLTNQMRRASVSISSNIAEGFKRFHKKEKLQFYNISYSSVAELESQTEVAKKLHLLPENSYHKLISAITEVSKMINGFIGSLNSKSYILHSKKEGFTLVELLVAMSVFLVAITITVGVFVQALRTQRITNHLLSVNSNASLVVEQMAREIRTGFDFDLKPAGSMCVGGQREELIFTKVRNASANQVTYKLDDGAIVREECVGTGNSANCSGFESLTASNVSVSRLCFLETQANPSDPWRITMFLTIGSSNPQLAGNELNLQTTVSARILPEDLPSP